jgi:[ribosomal protein S5]-alanine N-acetyltransferase
MKLQTNRLVFREVSTDDLSNVHQLHSLPETDEFNTLGIPKSIQDTEIIISDWLALQNAKPQTSYVFCLDLVDTKQFIGLIALNIGKPKYRSAEVWYKIDSKYWGKGYATEALTTLLDFSFNVLKLHRIEAGCAVENIASIKVLEKVGMTKEGMKRKKLPIRGDWKDNYFYAILDEDFCDK